MKDIERRQFVTVALAGGGSLLLGLQACGGGGDAGNGSGGLPPELSSCGNAIAGNHSPGHAFTVALADLSLTTSKDYDIQGLADHSHIVTLTASNLADLKAGKQVMVTSTSGSSTNYPAHTHSVTISCS